MRLAQTLAKKLEQDDNKSNSKEREYSEVTHAGGRHHSGHWINALRRRHASSTSPGFVDYEV